MGNCNWNEHRSSSLPFRDRGVNPNEEARRACHSRSLASGRLFSIYLIFLPLPRTRTKLARSPRGSRTRRTEPLNDVPRGRSDPRSKAISFKSLFPELRSCISTTNTKLLMNLFCLYLMLGRPKQRDERRVVSQLSNSFAISPRYYTGPGTDPNSPTSRGSPSPLCLTVLSCSTKECELLKWASG